MARLLLQLSWPELRHHPWRNVAAVVAVMLGVALAFSVHLINASALGEFSAAVRAVNGEPDLQIVGPQAGFDEALYERVAQLSGVAVVSPVVEGETWAFDSAGQRVPIRIVGVDALVVAALAPALLPQPARRRRPLRRARPARRSFSMPPPPIVSRRQHRPASRSRPRTGGPACASRAASRPAAHRSA